MEPTHDEIIHWQIMLNFQAIQNDTNFINWYEYYGDTCDEIFRGMFERKSTEINWLTEKQKNAWYNIPTHMKEQLIDMIRDLFDSGVFSSGPIPCANISNVAKRSILQREKIIQKMRAGYANKDIQLIMEVCGDETKYNNLNQIEKSRVKKYWIDLAKLTIKLNQSIYYCGKDSPKFWKDLTLQWCREENIQ